MFHLATKYCCILMILKWREILQVLYKSPADYYFVPLHFTSYISAVCASLHHSNRIIRMNLTFCHILSHFNQFYFFRARLSRRSAESVALADWPGEDPDRAVRRHPGHLQADPLRDQHPPAQLLPGRQGGGGQRL